MSDALPDLTFGVRLRSLSIVLVCALASDSLEIVPTLISFGKFLVTGGVVLLEACFSTKGEDAVFVGELHQT